MLMFTDCSVINESDNSTQQLKDTKVVLQLIRVTTNPLFPRHVLARIFILPKMFRFLLCFPVFILAEGNGRKVV